MNMVGELVIVLARLSQASLEHNDSDLIAIAEEFERLTAELRDNAMDIRMLPIGTTFARFKRLVLAQYGFFNPMERILAPGSFSDQTQLRRGYRFSWGCPEHPPHVLVSYPASLQFRLHGRRIPVKRKSRL